MGQIIFNGQKPKYCHLQAIQSGGSKADYPIPNGEVWMVDTTNSSKPDDGTGKYDSYVIGDGTTVASELVVYNIEDKEYDSTKFSGLGKKILPKNIVSNKNVLTQAMVNTTNTIYRIQYDYDLNGQTITLPAGCVLEFDGGSLKNGTIVVNNTKIEGSPKILCDISGVLEEAYLTWFGIESDDTDADAGEVINRVESHVRKFIIPKGNWYISTPCTLSCRKIEWLGEMYYVGEATDVRVVTITGYYTELQMSGSLICQNSAVNYTTANMTNIWGLVFKNMQFGFLKVGNINYFNVNVVIIGEGTGTCNNVFMLSLLRHANIGILITQKDVEGKIGWANENTFIGGKIGNLSSWNYTTCESHAVVVKKVFEDDNYAKVNSLMFLKQNCEGFKIYPVFLFENVSGTTVSEIRLEGVDAFYKLIGKSYSNSFSKAFGNDATKDISEVTYSTTAAPLKFEYSGSCCKYFDIRDSSLVSDEGDIYISKGTLVGFNTRIQYIEQVITKTESGASFFGLSLNILPTTSTNIRLRLRNTTGARKFVYLKAKDFHEGTSTTNQNALITGTSLSYNDVYNYWTTGADISVCNIVVRGGVKTLYISFNRVQSFSIEYNPSDVSINSNHPTSGTTEDRPTSFLYKGRKYFDTTKDEPVWWDGTKWVESKKPIYKILDVLLGNVLKVDHSGSNRVTFSPIIVNTSNQHTASDILGYAPAGIILPYLNKGKYTIKVDESFRVYIAYYDSEYQRLQGIAPTSSIGKVYAWNTGFGGVWRMTNTYATDEVVNIPEVENAAYVFIGIVTSGSISTNRFIIESTELQYRASDVSVRTSGTTANRPTERWAGYEYFDTDLGKPIYWNGAAWVDATGTTV